MPPLITAAALVAVTLLSGAAAAQAQSAATSKEAVVLRGAGATLPAPLYEKWIQAYRQVSSEVSVSYQAVGSGEGQRRFLAGVVDFGASDAALSDDQLAQAKSGARLVPVTAGIVVLAYNLPGLGGPLKLSRETYVDIFAGRIRSWSDPKIRADNPGLNLPNHNIAIVARQDSSGTTFAFTNHLSAISATWRDRGPGTGNMVDWRGTAMLAKGNEGVAGRIKVSEDSIGYVEYHFAKRLGLPMAQLQNKAGRFVEPGERSGQVALASTAGQIPANLRLFLPDPPGEESYPIATYSWLLLYARYPDPGKGAALKKFVSWGLTNGQAYSRELGYIPLPTEVASLALAALDRID